jgi:uncharacterized membrane protein HdeD (DUF308 family)
VTSASSDRPFDVRHVQLARAAFAALAAIMITFSPDHSAQIGMAVFSGFAIATGLVLLAAVWIVYPAGRRWPSAALGGITLVAGMISGLGPVRSITGYFSVVIAWALVTGLIELLAGWRGLRAPKARREIVPGVADARPLADPGPRSDSRDHAVIGVAGILLGVALLCVPTGYALQYTIEEIGEHFTLTGITIGVGIFGAYAAIVAVYLGIAGFSPRKDAALTTEAEASLPADQKDPA